MPHHDSWPFVIDPRAPWLGASSPSGYPRRVIDRRTGVQSQVRTEAELRAFMGRHGAPTHMGLGDVVRAVTKRLGFGECAPCAKRQAALNAAVPRVFRR